MLPGMAASTLRHTVLFTNVLKAFCILTQSSVVCRFVCVVYIYKSVFTVVFVFSPCKVVTLFARKRKFILQTFRDRIYHTLIRLTGVEIQNTSENNNI